MPREDAEEGGGVGPEQDPPGLTERSVHGDVVQSSPHPAPPCSVRHAKHRAEAVADHAEHVRVPAMRVPEAENVQ